MNKSFLGSLFVIDRYTIKMKIKHDCAGFAGVAWFNKKVLVVYSHPSSHFLGGPRGPTGLT